MHEHFANFTFEAVRASDKANHGLRCSHHTPGCKVGHSCVRDRIESLASPSLESEQDIQNRVLRESRVWGGYPAINEARESFQATEVILDNGFHIHEKTMALSGWDALDRNQRLSLQPLLRNFHPAKSFVVGLSRLFKKL